MLKLVDLTYHTNTEFDTPIQLLRAQEESLGYVNFIKDLLKVQVIKHMPHEHSITVDSIKYSFFTRLAIGLKIPFRTLRYLAKAQPDIILIQGFTFPLQVLLVRLLLGKEVVLILQHHGEKPCPGLTMSLHKIISRTIDAYLFTSFGNSKEWIQSKVISDPNKCFEIQAASTSFVKQDKIKSQRRCGISGSNNFIWVGRLNENKDPLTVLSGFETFIESCPDAKLYMIYQTDELLHLVQDKISGNEKLRVGVKLIGKVEHMQLMYWYSASDYYISGSHQESCGFALIEAMACGCIPIVTDIPSFRKITNGGQFGLLYQPGDIQSLANAFVVLPSIPLQQESRLIKSYFEKELSFKSIAHRLYTLCQKLAGERLFK